jgi:hypothetical protein
MPSSTSSSEMVDYRSVPQQPWKPLILIATGLVIVAIIGWELLAREMHFIPGAYNDTGATWAAERRKLDVPNDIKVILAGSSRLLWAADLDIFENELGTRPLQLALPGTSPRLIVKSVVEASDFAGLIVVGFTTRLFFDPTEGFAGGKSLEAYEWESPSSQFGNLLYAGLEDHIAFIDSNFSLFYLLEIYTHLPVREGSKDLLASGGKLGNVYADRQTDMWLPVEDRDSYQNQLTRNFWDEGLNEAPPSNEEIREKFDTSVKDFSAMLETLRARGGDMLFIRMPSDGNYLARDLKDEARTRQWQPFIEAVGAPNIHSHDYPQLSTDLDIPEWSHLSRASQDLWSHAAVPLMRAEFEQNRGQPLQDYLDGVNEGNSK